MKQNPDQGMSVNDSGNSKYEHKLEGAEKQRPPKEELPI
jgi:hypothetical protein